MPAFTTAACHLEPFVRLVTFNTDRDDPPAGYRIDGVPTLILFHGSKELARGSGARSTGQIVGWVRIHLPAGSI